MPMMVSSGPGSVSRRSWRGVKHQVGNGVDEGEPTRLDEGMCFGGNCPSRRNRWVSEHTRYPTVGELALLARREVHLVHGSAGVGLNTSEYGVGREIHEAADHGQQLAVPNHGVAGDPQAPKVMQDCRGAGGQILVIDAAVRGQRVDDGFRCLGDAPP